MAKTRKQLTPEALNVIHEHPTNTDVINQINALSAAIYSQSDNIRNILGVVAALNYLEKPRGGINPGAVTFIAGVFLGISLGLNIDAIVKAWPW